MPNQYPNGIGASLGDSLATCRPLTTTGAVWYVDSATGTNNVSPAGRNREKSLASLQQAITNASAGDIISCLSGHTQSVTSTINVSKALTIVGEGSAGGLPTVVFSAGASTAVITVTAANCELRNIKIGDSSAANVNPRLDIQALNCLLDGLYIPCGATDPSTAIRIIGGANYTRIRNTTIISTATSTSAQPGSAITVTGPVDDLVMEGVVFSAGTVGFSNIYAFDCSSAPVTRLVAQDISLLLGADMRFDSSTTGRLNLQTVTGGSRVEW